MNLQENSDTSSSKTDFLHTLIPGQLLDNHQTRLKSLVLLLTLAVNIAINIVFLVVINIAFDKTPMVQENGSLLIYCCIATYVLAYILFRAMKSLVIAGNMAQMGVYFASLITSWMTGGSTSPMMYLLLIPPVLAFILTNLTSGVIWLLITGLSYYLVWAIDEYALDWFSNDFIDQYPMILPQQIFIDSPQFYQMNMIIPVITCLAVVSVVAIYELNNIKLNRLLSQERNMFAFKASHDPLTGLANRDEFNLQLQMAIRQGQHSSYPVALVYIDLDGFKPINDTIGHHAGDIVLEHVSQRLTSIVRGTDTVARMGGDEFAIILQGISDEAQITPILEKILRTIGEDIPLDDGSSVSVKGSLGVAFYPVDAETPDQLCRHADMAMYLAKEEKNTWRFYSQVPHPS